MGDRRAVGRVASHVAAVAAGAAAATAIGAAAGPSPGDRFRSLDVFAQALTRIESDYVDPVDRRRLVYDAIDGMVAGLDEHSDFLPRASYRQLRETTEGELVGIGVVVVDDDGGPVVTIVAPGSPAARAGLARGDRVLAVDGVATPGRTAARLRRRLRGAPGTQVTLAVSRTGWPAPRDIALVREVVRISAVEQRLFEPGFGYLRIRQFQGGTAAEVSAALAALRDGSGGSLRGLVLDMRGNPGGLLDQGVAVADLFLAEGTIATLSGRDGVEEDKARAPGSWLGFPIAVVVDQGTASAAELATAALQENGRAVVVGSRTYGKGSVQTFIDLGDGSGLKLTTARYRTPRGGSLDGTGLIPDVVVGPDPASGEAAASAPGGDPGVIDHRLGIAYQTVRQAAASKESDKGPTTLPNAP